MEKMNFGVYILNAVSIVLLLNFTTVCCGTPAGLFLGKYSFSVGNLSVRMDGTVQAFVHFNVPNESLIEASDQIVLIGMPLQNISRNIFVGDLNSLRSTDEGITSYLITDLELESNYTVNILRNNSILISDTVTLLTTSLQRVVVERISEGVFYTECHFLSNTRTEGCRICCIPVERGMQRANRNCYEFMREDNGTALVANGSIDDLQIQTTYRVKAFGVNNGLVLHPFPIVPDLEIIMTANNTLQTVFTNIWFIVGMSTLLIVLIATCIVICIGITILCSKLKKRKKRKMRRKNRSYAMRNVDGIIVTRRNKCYTNINNLKTTQEDLPHDYEDIDLTDFIARESAYDNVTLNGEEIVASPIESPTLVPIPMLTTSKETGVEVAVVQTHVSSPLRKSSSLDSYLETRKTVVDSVSPAPLTSRSRGHSTFVKQMCQHIERGDMPFRISCKESRSKSTYPARSKLRKSQRECCASDSKWSNGSLCKPTIKVSEHCSTKIEDDRFSTCSITSHSSSLDTEISSRATSSESLTSDHISTASLSWPGVYDAANQLEPPPSNHGKKRKANTLNLRSQLSQDQQPQDYEVPVSSKSLPRNMQPI